MVFKSDFFFLLLFLILCCFKVIWCYLSRMVGVVCPLDAILFGIIFFLLLWLHSFFPLFSFYLSHRNYFPSHLLSLAAFVVNVVNEENIERNRKKIPKHCRFIFFSIQITIITVCVEKKNCGTPLVRWKVQFFFSLLSHSISSALLALAQRLASPFLERILCVSAFTSKWIIETIFPLYVEWKRTK